MSKSGKQKETKKNDPPSGTVENVGKHLQQLRTEKGLSIQEVSDITRISVVNLNAIENQDFDSLPANTFTRGFISIYSNFLGGDTPTLVARFMEERDARRIPAKKARTRHSSEMFSPKTLAEPSHVSSMTMAGVLLLIIIVVFTGFCLYTSWNPFSFLFTKSDNFQSVMDSVFLEDSTVDQQSAYPELNPSTLQSVPSSPDKTPTGDDPAVEPGGTARQEDGNGSVGQGATLLQQSGEQAAEEPRYLVHATFLKNTRVRVVLDGHPSLDERFYSGDEKDWSADRSIQLVFSQADSASLLVNGEPVDFPEEVNGMATFWLRAE